MHLSTGGLIALGLGAKNWSVEECTRHFEALCKQAFTRRTGGNIPGVAWFVENHHHSRYKTRPLEEALIDAFSDDEHLFGGFRPHASYGTDVKVAVTSTSASGSPVVLANYNRLCREKRKRRKIYRCFRSLFHVLTLPSSISIPAARKIGIGVKNMGSVREM